jgi:hypothetical protein
LPLLVSHQPRLPSRRWILSIFSSKSSMKLQETRSFLVEIMEARCVSSQLLPEQRCLLCRRFVWRGPRLLPRRDSFEVWKTE